MSNSIEYLVRKASFMVGSQNELAKKMNQTPSIISDWKGNRRAIGCDKIAELARLAGEDEGKWVALISVEKTQHEGAKRWIQQLAGSALFLLALAYFAPQFFETSSRMCIM